MAKKGIRAGGASKIFSAHYSGSSNTSDIIIAAVLGLVIYKGFKGIQNFLDSNFKNILK